MEQNAKKKIPCGGFMLGEGLVLSEDGKTLSVRGGRWRLCPQASDIRLYAGGVSDKERANYNAYGRTGTYVHIK